MNPCFASLGDKLGLTVEQTRQSVDVLVVRLVRHGIELDRALVVPHGLPKPVAAMALEQIPVAREERSIGGLRDRLLVQPLRLPEGVLVPRRLVDL